MAAIIRTGTLAMTGQQQTLHLGFRPSGIFAYLETADAAAKYPLWWTPTSWCERTVRFGASNSFAGGVAGVLGDGDVVIGTDAEINVAGATLHYVAMDDNGAGAMSETGWMGSPAAWAPIVGESAPLAIMVKRDSNLPPVIRTAGMTGSISVVMDGTGPVTDGLTALNADGTVSIGTLANVNQLSGGAIGEGHDCIALWSVPGLIEEITWTGNGVAGRVVPHGIANPALALIVPMSGATKAGIKIDTMGARLAWAGSQALIDGAVTSMAGGVTLGADTRYNTAGVVYRAIIVGKSTDRQKREFPPVTGRSAAYIRGSATSHINCGTDASLSFPGAQSWEWWGKIPLSMGSTTLNPGYLLARSAGDEGRADSDGAANGAGTRLDGTWSVGLMAQRFNDLGDWAGPQFGVVVGDYNNFADSAGSENDIRTKPWRTGILVPRERFHVLVTLDGAGRCNLWLNGKLVKQRKIDLTGVTLADDAGARKNAHGGAGHRMVLGARQGTSAVARLSRQLFEGASLYGRVLTASEIKALYRRNFLGDLTVTDVAPTERWLADDITGTSLPAKISAANNGALTSTFKVPVGRY